MGIGSLFHQNSETFRPLPPGPPLLHMIGNILLLKKKPHRVLTDLAKTYGHVMMLKLGTITSIVISSPEAAKEVFHKHDQALSSRTIVDSARVLDHHKFSLVWLPAASAQWRFLRKVCVTQMFTKLQLDAAKELRQRKVRELQELLLKKTVDGGLVDIGQAAFITILNSISNTLFSVDLAGYESDSINEIIEIVAGVTELAGKPNIADYFPLLRFLDPQGIHRKSKEYSERFFRVLDDIVAERMRTRSSSESKTRTNDVLDCLFSVMEENGSDFGLTDLKHLLSDLVVAGVDTSSNTVQWALSELIRNPEKMVKVQREVRQITGRENDEGEEVEICRLPYLQAVVKETLRLHTPGPFLVPRKAESSVELCGYRVPKDAQILVNVWAIARDSRIWKNPDEFEPERFMGRDIDVKGRDFELIPFGAGRRICPGLPLALRMVHLTLASLCCFDWKLGDGLNPKDLDITENLGLVLHKAIPLTAIPIKTSPDLSSNN